MIVGSHTEEEENTQQSSILITRRFKLSVRKLFHPFQIHFKHQKISKTIHILTYKDITDQLIGCYTDSFFRIIDNCLLNVASILGKIIYNTGVKDGVRIRPGCIYLLLLLCYAQLNEHRQQRALPVRKNNQNAK